MIERLVPQSVTLNDPNPDFKGKLLRDVEYFEYEYSVVAMALSYIIFEIFNVA